MQSESLHVVVPMVVDTLVVDVLVVVVVVVVVVLAVDVLVIGKLVSVVLVIGKLCSDVLMKCCAIYTPVTINTTTVITSMMMTITFFQRDHPALLSYVISISILYGNISIFFLLI